MNKNQSFEAIMEEHWSAVYGLCHRIMGNDSDAEESAQQTFYQAFRSWDSFKGRAKPITWLYRIAVNVCRRYILKKRRYVSLPRNELTDPKSEYVRNPTEGTAQLHQAIQSLKPAQRMIITLVYIEKISHKEIAEILNCPEGTLWSRLYYAKKALEEKMNFFKSEYKS